MTSLVIPFLANPDKESWTLADITASMLPNLPFWGKHCQNIFLIELPLIVNFGLLKKAGHNL
jgi:hypothetical protein